jgi:hypothetical protein
MTVNGRSLNLELFEEVEESVLDLYSGTQNVMPPAARTGHPGIAVSLTSSSRPLDARPSDPTPTGTAGDQLERSRVWP